MVKAYNLYSLDAFYSRPDSSLNLHPKTAMLYFKLVIQHIHNLGKNGYELNEIVTSKEVLVSLWRERELSSFLKALF